jgi:hypothetical protein
MTEAVRTSQTSVDNYFTQQYIPEDNSELHTRRRENLKSQISKFRLNSFYSLVFSNLGSASCAKTGPVVKNLPFLMLYYNNFEALYHILNSILQWKHEEKNKIFYLALEMVQYMPAYHTGTFYSWISYRYLPKPGQGDGFLRTIKIRSTPSSRMGSKAGRSHVVRFYGM